MRSVARVILLLSLSAFAACGGDGGNGVTNPPGGGSPAIDVTGTWFMTGLLIGVVDGEGNQCLVSGFVQLSQSGSNISGSYTDVEGQCIPASANTSFEFTWGAGQITNGSLSGNTIKFDFGSDWSNTGLIFAQAPSGMTGTSTVTIDFGGSTGRVTLNGSWEAVK